MSDTQKSGLSPETVLAEMKRNGVTHVVWLPDSETNWLYLLMKSEPSLTLVGVNREGLAFSAAAGIAAGGKKPLILIQNTGLMESGDSLRGWAIGLKYSEGFTRLVPSVLTLAGMAASMLLLGIAVRNLPVGTAYAVWVGIGAAGAAILGMVLFKEPATFARLGFLALLVISILGLKLTSPGQ